MNDLRTAAQQALEAMLHFPGDISDEMFESITALKAALAEPAQEPVAWKQGNLVTFNEDPYPALGDLFVQFWDGEEVAARVYANDLETIRQRCAKVNTAPPQQVAQQAEPLNLRDPAVQKRLASQWGYVPAAQESVPAAVVGTQSDVWRGYNGQWQAPGEPIKTVQMLRDLPTGTLLYTAPPQRKPLTEEEIDKIFNHLCNTVGASCKTMARAVERAHGIKE